MTQPRGISLKDIAKWKPVWRIDKFEFPPEICALAEKALMAGESIESVIAQFGSYLGSSKFEGNLLLNAGITAMWQLIATSGATAYTNANARLGVGDSTVAAAATQTGLQAVTNKYLQGMDAGYPTVSGQTVTFRITVAGANANFGWQEFITDNGSVALVAMNRVVSNQGTKTSGQTWVLTLTITLS